VAAQFKLTVVNIQCVNPSQPGKSETVRLNIVKKGYCAYSGTHSMNTGVVWQLDKTFIFGAADIVIIEGLQNKTCMPVFMAMIPAKVQTLITKVAKASDNTPYYKIKYKVETDTSVVSASTSSKTFGSTIRYVHSDGWGGLQLYLNSSNIGSKPYTGKYKQADEKDSSGNVLADYCGPTAGKNLAVWYGTSDKSYIEAGKLMKTNNYSDDPEIIAISFLIVPVIGAIVLNIIKPGGTLPKYMNNFLARGDVRSNNLTVMWKNAGNSPYLSRWGLEYEVRTRIKNGHPVMALIYTQSGALHWVLITGFFLDGGKWKVRLANHKAVVWSDFCNMWYLSKIDSIIRGILGWVHIHPYTRLYY
jgi:hypothetical protein